MRVASCISWEIAVPRVHRIGTWSMVRSSEADIHMLICRISVSRLWWRVDKPWRPVKLGGADEQASNSPWRAKLHFIGNFIALQCKVVSRYLSFSFSCCAILVRQATTTQKGTPLGLSDIYIVFDLQRAKSACQLLVSHLSGILRNLALKQRLERFLVSLPDTCTDSLHK